MKRALAAAVLSVAFLWQSKADGSQPTLTMGGDFLSFGTGTVTLDVGVDSITNLYAYELHLLVTLMEGSGSLSYVNGSGADVILGKGGNPVSLLQLSDGLAATILHPGTAVNGSNERMASFAFNYSATSYAQWKVELKTPATLLCDGSLKPIPFTAQPGFVIATGPEDLLWKGSTDNKWDINQTANWSAGGVARKYREGDGAIFDDTGTNNQPVNIQAAVNPGSVLFSNNTSSIALGGPGSIAGACSVTKSGNGSLTLSGANTYAGGTEVTGGTLLASNPSGSATGSGAVTVGAATLGGTGFISGPVALTGDSILTSAGTLTINNTLTIDGLANMLSSGIISTAGDVTINPGAVFIVNGTLGGGTGSLIVRGTLMGKGTIGKNCVIQAGGVLSPGEPSTIQSMPQVRVAAPQGFSFELGASQPDYTNPSNSVNDLIHLTSDLPFADAAGQAPASFTRDTLIDIYFLFKDLPEGQYELGFFAGSDFTEAIAGATFRYWRLDPRGGRFHNGNLWSPLDPSLVDWSVVPDVAEFGGMPVSGYITEFKVVPEPATLALLGLGAAFATAAKRRSRA